jgi:O-antigen/teichoic acid export membrane protein
MRGWRRIDLTNLDEPQDDDPRKYDAVLRKKTRRSVAWTLLRVVSDQLFAFIVFVVLARLLSPAEIGAFAIAQAFAEIGRAIAISGMVQNIVRAKRMSRALADTVFWTNMAMSIVLALVMLGIAPLITALIGQPSVTAPLQVLGFALPLAALGATHLSLRLREFGHKTLAIRSAVAHTAGGAAAVAAAFAGWGIWSLVVQRFVTEAANTLMSWQAYRWMPGGNVSWEQFRAIWHFGFNVALTQVVNRLPRRVTDIILGTMIDAAAVGINRIARRTTELILAGTTSPFAMVANQTLARLQSDHEEMVKAYRGLASKSAMLAFPAFIGLGVLAPDAVPAIFGDKWEVSGQIVQIFAWMAIPYVVGSFTGPLLMTLGRAATLRTFAIGQVISTIVFVAAAAPFGLIWVAWAQVIRSYLALPFQLWMVRRASGVTPRDMLSVLTAPFIASLIMGILVWVLMSSIRANFTIVLVPILICVAAGLPIYALLLYAFSADARNLVHHRLKALRRKKSVR